MHYEALPEEGKHIFEKLQAFDSFYLAGGTALALQIGHRISVDFDLFSQTEIPANLLVKAKRVYANHAVTPSVNNKEELTVFAGNTKITFLYYPFPLVKPLVDTNGISLLSISEIGATKAYTIGRRGSFKDYVDIHAIISGNHASLEDILHLAEQKFGNEFNGRLFLEQLIYLQDVEDVDSMFLSDPVSKDTLQMYFEEEIKKLKI